MTPSVLRRFIARLDIQPDGCWLWRGATNPDGYGKLWVDGAHQYVHRLAYELFHGPIPSGCEVDHVWDAGCRHKNCVRPDHLEAVTHLENTRRGHRGRLVTACPAGHPYTPENTYRTKQGWRRCRACARDRAHRARQPEGVAA